MTEPTYGNYNINEVEGIEKLRDRMRKADSIKDWSHILSDYITFGNSKIDKRVAIFNMNSATDCPNADTENCQVPWNQCYAHKSENMYNETLPYRRRQNYLWDCMDADTWAKAFLKLVERKRNRVTAIRFSQAGDFRHNGDIIKVDRIAEIVGKEGIEVYTYSASNYLNWSLAENFTVMASNDIEPYGDKRYIAVPTKEDIPEDALYCPYDRTDGEIECGECRACIAPHGPDVAITLH